MHLLSGPIERTCREEAAAVEKEKTASEKKAVSEEALNLKQTHLRTINELLVELANRSDRLELEEVDAKNSNKGFPKELESSVDTWKAELISDDGKRALVHPLPCAAANVVSRRAHPPCGPSYSLPRPHHQSLIPITLSTVSL